MQESSGSSTHIIVIASFQSRKVSLFPEDRMWNSDQKYEVISAQEWRNSLPSTSPAAAQSSSLSLQSHRCLWWRVQGRDADRSRRKNRSVCQAPARLTADWSPKYWTYHEERLEYRAPRKRMVQLAPVRTVFVYVCQSFQLFIRMATDGTRQMHALFHSFLQNEQMSSLHATWPHLTKCDKKQR